MGLRRDIGILGFLHKANLRQCHPCIQALFRVGLVSNARSISDLGGPPKHNKCMESYIDRVTTQHDLYHRSIFNTVRIYNILPQSVVDEINVKAFQSKLTHVARLKCEADRANWACFLSPRSWDMTKIMHSNGFRICAPFILK